MEKSVLNWVPLTDVFIQKIILLNPSSYQEKKKFRLGLTYFNVCKYRMNNDKGKTHMYLRR